MIRLNKYISECGVCSRRSADTLIQSGKVSVNGEVITDRGVKIDEISDTIAVDNKIIKKEDKLVYIMLNKPKGYVTTSKEQFGRKSVLDLIDTNLRVYPIGRLDMYTEGLLLLTNDGNFANEMMHPKNKIEKTYIAKVSGNITNEKIEMLKRHYKLLLESTSEKAAILEIRMHALWYIKGLPNSSTIKDQICKTKTSVEIFTVLDNYLKELSNI